MKTLRSKKGIYYAVMTSEQDKDLFYSKLGRFFCSKKVTEEMGGYQVYDTPFHIWIVAFDGDTEGKAVGFSSFSIEKADKKIINYADSYVDPDYRKKGIYLALFKYREKEALKYLPKGGKLKGIAMAISEPIFHKCGYEKRSQRGRFAYMEKEVVKS